MKNVLLPIVVVGLLLAGAPVIADTLVDQQQLINNAPHDLTHTGLQGLVQGFTPSVNRLDGVEIYFDSWGSGPNTNSVVDVEIYNCLSTSNTLPDWDAGILGQGSRTLIFDTEPIGWKEILLDSSVTLVPGNNYSIVMLSSSQQRVKLGRNWTSPGDPYTGGGYAAWIIGNTNATAEYVDIFEDDKLDMTFKTLYEGTAATHNPGDVDDDNFVGGADLTTVLTNWGNSGVTWTDGDVDPYNDGITTGDDFIGGGDYTAVLTAWGTSYGPEAVPEPATLLVLLAGAGLAVARRRR